MRRLIDFSCAGDTLVGTLDAAPGATGLLIVSGGNEIRIGAHRGMALLAARLAERGVPVFRFDRRGIGDSTGDNRGYTSSGPDIAAAATTFRAVQPQITRLVAFGNCDAATALVLFGGEAGIEALLLANPWVVETEDDLPPAAAIQAHYADRLRDPKEWLRAARGGIDFRKLASGLKKLSEKSNEDGNALAAGFFRAVPTTAAVILAKRDATAITFADSARRHGWSGTPTMVDTASHSFARDGDADALFEAIAAAIG